MSTIEGVNLTKSDVKKEYFRFIEEINHRKLRSDRTVHPVDLWLGFGSALTMEGLRKTTHDLDVGCTEEVFKIVKNALKIEPEIFSNPNHGYLTLHAEILRCPEFNSDLHLETQTTEADRVMIDGVYCWNLETVLRFKKQMNRPKDQADIIQIQRELDKRNKKKTITKESIIMKWKKTH